MIFKRKEKNNTDSPYLIVGLGNPGKDYKQNRHNIGFLLMDEICRQENQSFSKMENKAMVSKFQKNGKRLILAKPRTFMNNSGISIGGLVRFYKIPQSNILIAYDDVDLPLHTIRMKPAGGSAGHNGIKSIIQHLGTNDFNRLRIGVNRPPGRMKTPDYVLQDFSKQEKSELPLILDRSVKAINTWLTKGIETAMNEFNQIP
jgi:peptidyl-tRNA hydrolase, PTH1 family